MNNCTKYIQPEIIAHDILMAEIQKLLADNQLPTTNDDIIGYYCEHYQSAYQKIRFVCTDQTDKTDQKE